MLANRNSHFKKMQQKTQLLHAHQKADLEQALYLLQQGELVAVPTETVYGLAGDASNLDALHKIFIAKNRPTSHPLIVHIASPEKLGLWAKDIPPEAMLLARHFWPGPLTLLLKKADPVNTVVSGGLPTIALRVPQHPTLLALLHALDKGLAAPSANPHKKISPTMASHVMEGLSGKIAAVLDAGPCTIGLESTIVDLTRDVPTVVRPGPITPSQLEAVLQAPVRILSAPTTRVAGNMRVHYQPHTPTSLMSLTEIQYHLACPEHQEKRFAVMHYSASFTDTRVHREKMPSEKSLYAQKLYSTLHALDKQGFYAILIEQPPEAPLWDDIIDRLSKACARGNTSCIP